MLEFGRGFHDMEEAPARWGAGVDLIGEAAEPDTVTPELLTRAMRKVSARPRRSSFPLSRNGANVKSWVHVTCTRESWGSCADQAKMVATVHTEITESPSLIRRP